MKAKQTVMGIPVPLGCGLDVFSGATALSCFFNLNVISLQGCCLAQTLVQVFFGEINLWGFSCWSIHTLNTLFVLIPQFIPFLTAFLVQGFDSILSSDLL